MSFPTFRDLELNFLMSTKGLKNGDVVDYKYNGLQFTATVVNVTSSQKAQIRAHLPVNDYFNPSTVVNTYRKYMTIVKS